MHNKGDKLMKTNNNFFNNLYSLVRTYIGVDEIDEKCEIEVDENDVNKAIDIINKGTFGNDNNYIDELIMAKYFAKVEKMTSSKSTSDSLISYSSFLGIDGLAKYILSSARQKRAIDRNTYLMYSKSLKDLFENIKKYGPMDKLNESLDDYLEICHTLLKMIVRKKYGFAL